MVLDFAELWMRWVDGAPPLQAPLIPVQASNFATSSSPCAMGIQRRLLPSVQQLGHRCSGG